MKKIVLLFSLICSVTKLYSQDIMLIEDFNGLTVGNLGTDLGGSNPGQGGWYTYAASGATNSDFKVVNVTSGDNALELFGNSGPSAAQGSPSVTRYTEYYFDDPATGWDNRTVGNNVAYLEYVMYTGSTTTSLNSFNLSLVSTTSKFLAGFNFSNSTKKLQGLAYKDETANGGSLNTWAYSLGANGTALTLTPNSKINLVLIFNKTTGKISWIGEGAGASFYWEIDGAGAGLDISHLAIYVSAGSGNASSTSVKFDDFYADARCAEFPTKPTFNAVGPICSGATLTLPTSSTNTTPFAGSWTPSVNNTATTTYTFTPNLGVCASTTTMEVVVNQPVTPTFASIPSAVCSGTTVSPLPASSSNTTAISGTWSPAFNGSAQTTYTFTPAAGQCAVTPNTVTIGIDQPVVPTFNSISAFCAGTSAPSLPSTSTNNPAIPGTWKLNNNTVTQISNVNATSSPVTSSYLFVPASGQCATTNVTLDVTVNPSITPTFSTSSTTLCSGDVANLPSPTNSPTISGTWSPSSITNTNTTSAAVTSTYTFTASGGTCVSNGTYSVTVNPKVTPTFSVATSLCSGSTAPTLPTTSTNSIQGTWNPSVVSNTATASYLFTPNSGVCASTASVTVTINNTPVAPTFDAIQPICMGATAPTLPSTSTNSISGTWSPATVSNLQTKNYTFTPSTACGSPTTITVTVTPNVVPSFTIASSICSGATAPTLATTSNELVPGTWSPSVVSNTATGNYVFTPTTGVCAVSKTVTVTVTPNVAPTFTLPAYVCTGATVPTLPTTSTNNVTGTWSPATVSNVTTGSYTFTPTAGSCATPTAAAILVSSCAGIEETSNKVYSIYPNPANDFITISFSDVKENKGVVNFFAADGKIIETREFSNSTIESFNVKSLNPGVYFFQIGNAIEKVVVQ